MPAKATLDPIATAEWLESSNALLVELSVQIRNADSKPPRAAEAVDTKIESPVRTRRSRP
jgi:hypothetical protein